MSSSSNHTTAFPNASIVAAAWRILRSLSPTSDPLSAEISNLFTQSGFYKETNSLENVYREIRAFGQGIVSITQHPSMLPIYLLGNCHTQIYLGLQNEDDIKTARKALFLRYDQEPYLN